MRYAAFRRILSVFVALAFLSGLQAAAMPMAPAGSDGIMQLAGQQVPHDCKACSPQSMTAGSCFTVCASVPILTDQAAFAAQAPGTSRWSWLIGTLPTAGVQPDLSPPRS